MAILRFWSIGHLLESRMSNTNSAIYDCNSFQNWCDTNCEFSMLICVFPRSSHKVAFTDRTTLCKYSAIHTNPKMIKKYLLNWKTDDMKGLILHDATADCFYLGHFSVLNCENSPMKIQMHVIKWKGPHKVYPVDVWSEICHIQLIHIYVNCSVKQFCGDDKFKIIKIVSNDICIIIMSLQEPSFTL